MNRRSHAIAAFVLAAGAAVLAQRAGTPQQALPTFRATANLIEVDAVVTDRNGEFVRGLTRDDFEVLEDKKPQAVATFALIDLPVRITHAAAGATLPPMPDVASNAIEGRIYLLVLDRINLDPAESVRWKRAVRQFVLDDVGPGDLVGLVSLGLSARGCEFTTDKARVLRALDGMGAAPNTDQIAADATLAPSGAGGQGAAADAEIADVLSRAVADEMGGYMNDVRHAYQALDVAAQYLIGIHGRRKAIIMFSDGLGVDMHSGAPNGNPRTEALGLDATAIVQDVIRAALRANVSIYTVAARGLAVNPASGLPVGWESLQVMSQETGGRAIVAFNDLTEPFRKIVEDSSAYYVLGYYGSGVKPDGGFHDITVRVKRPNLKVQARKGYYATSNSDAKLVKAIDETWARTDLGSLLSRSVPTSDLGLILRATAAPVASNGKTVTVAVSLEVGAGGLSFENRSGVFADEVEVAHFAIDDAGVAQAKGSEVVNLRLRPQTHDAVAARGWRFVTQVDLAPGHYQLRLAVREQPNGRAGSVFVDIDVPDFAGTPLQLGAIALSSSRAADMPTAGKVPALAGVLPGPPIGTRIFHATDRLGVFARVSENAEATPHTVEIATTIRTADGREVVRTSQPHASKDLGAMSQGYLAILPLSGLPAGSYVLTVTATSFLGGPPVVRSVPFTIE